MNPSKRDILLALAALGAGAASPALAQSGAAPLDLSAGRAIGEAYIAANPSESLDALRFSLIPNGFGAEVLARLRTSVADDFRHGAIFSYQGWRLSRTEARLFALLT